MGNCLNATVSTGYIINGVSPTISVVENTETSYVLKITDINGSFVTPNLRGGGSASEMPSEADYSIAVALDNTNYKLTISLLNGLETISSQTVDFPIEGLVVNGSYNNVSKSLTLTLQNGKTVNIPIGDLVSGLASTSYVDSLISGITQLVNKANSDIATLRGEVESVKSQAKSAETLAQKAYELAQNAGGGATELQAGENIKIQDNVISVITTNNAEEDNTRPITSAGVNTIVGNIDVLLRLI